MKCNPVLATLPTFLVLTVAMILLSDGGECQVAKLPVIVQVTAPCVCGHTPWLQSRLVTEASMLPVINLVHFIS